MSNFQKRAVGMAFCRKLSEEGSELVAWSPAVNVLCLLSKIKTEITTHFQNPLSLEAVPWIKEDPYLPGSLTSFLPDAIQLQVVGLRQISFIKRLLILLIPIITRKRLAYKYIISKIQGIQYRKTSKYFHKTHTYWDQMHCHKFKWMKVTKMLIAETQELR